MAKKFKVEGFGCVNEDHSVFMFCKELDKVRALEPGRSVAIEFQTGVGKTTVSVERMPDAAEERM